MEHSRQAHTPEYQRQERALIRARKQARFEGILTMVFCVLLAVFSLLLLIGWMMARTAPWYAYALLLIITFAGGAALFAIGIHTSRQGRLPVHAHEIIARKEAHRRTLQKEAMGHRPLHYRLCWKIGSLLMCLFFLLLASSAWHGYAASPNSAMLVEAVVHSIFALLTGLLALRSFCGASASQRSRVRELRQLLMEEECTTTSDER